MKFEKTHKWGEREREWRDYYVISNIVRKTSHESHIYCLIRVNYYCYYYYLYIY